LTVFDGIRVDCGNPQIAKDSVESKFCPEVSKMHSGHKKTPALGDESRRFGKYWASLAASAVLLRGTSVHRERDG
jgi:hypothetical protein